MEKYLKKIQKHLKHISRDEFEYDIHISLRYKYIYVETPKVGCSTIKDTLQRIELDYPELIRDDFEDIHRRGFSPLLCPSQTCDFDRLLQNPEYFSFCFVRNPYTRLLSGYLDKIVKSKSHKKNILVALDKDPEDLSKEITFQEFVDVVCDLSVSQMDPHWRMQYYQTFQDSINYDFIGRMENFENDCVKVFSRIKNNYSDYYRPEIRHATNSEDFLKKYYTTSIQKKVFDKFEIDFEHFNYDGKCLC